MVICENCQFQNSGVMEGEKRAVVRLKILAVKNVWTYSCRRIGLIVVKKC